jgi:hypothetical protein
VSACTPEALRIRLGEIAADPAWSTLLRLYARYASRGDAARRGFAVTPADLSDEAIRAALEELYAVRRAAAFGGVS